MRPSNLIRRAGVLAVTVAVALFETVSVHAFSADAVGTGTLVAWLSGLEFHATITGEIQLTGETALGGVVLPFSAEGTFYGFGVRGIVTLISEGWIGYAAEGRSAGGEPIEIRGLLYVKRESLIPLRAGDVLVGTQYALIAFGDETRSFRGEFTGAVEGALETAETPGTLQLGGKGNVHLEGEPGGFPASIPLDHPALPPEFLQYLAELGLGV